MSTFYNLLPAIRENYAKDRGYDLDTKYRMRSLTSAEAFHSMDSRFSKHPEILSARKVIEELPDEFFTVDKITQHMNADVQLFVLFFCGYNFFDTLALCPFLCQLMEETDLYVETNPVLRQWHTFFAYALVQFMFALNEAESRFQADYVRTSIRNEVRCLLDHFMSVDYSMIETNCIEGHDAFKIMRFMLNLLDFERIPSPFDGVHCVDGFNLTLDTSDLEQLVSNGFSFQMGTIKDSAVSPHIRPHHDGRELIKKELLGINRILEDFLTTTNHFDFFSVYCLNNYADCHMSPFERVALGNIIDSMDMISSLKALCKSFDFDYDTLPTTLVNDMAAMVDVFLVALSLPRGKDSAGLVTRLGDFVRLDDVCDTAFDPLLFYFLVAQFIHVSFYARDQLMSHHEMSLFTFIALMTVAHLSIAVKQMTPIDSVPGVRGEPIQHVTLEMVRSFLKDLTDALEVQLMAFIFLEKMGNIPSASREQLHNIFNTRYSHQVKHLNISFESFLQYHEQEPLMLAHKLTEIDTTRFARNRFAKLIGKQLKVVQLSIKMNNKPKKMKFTFTSSLILTNMRDGRLFKPTEKYMNMLIGQSIFDDLNSLIVTFSIKNNAKR
ncbi:hypothetical protein PCE1_004562 [Barthelona sp. PCE]